MKFCFNSLHQPSLSLFGLLALSILILSSLSSAGKPAEISVRFHTLFEKKTVHAN